MADTAEAGSFPGTAAARTLLYSAAGGLARAVAEKMADPAAHTHTAAQAAGKRVGLAADMAAVRGSAGKQAGPVAHTAVLAAAEKMAGPAVLHTAGLAVMDGKAVPVWAGHCPSTHMLRRAAAQIGTARAVVEMGAG